MNSTLRKCFFIFPPSICWLDCIYNFKIPSKQNHFSLKMKAHIIAKLLHCLFVHLYGCIMWFAPIQDKQPNSKTYFYHASIIWLCLNYLVVRWTIFKRILFLLPGAPRNLSVEWALFPLPRMSWMNRLLGFLLEIQLTQGDNKVKVKQYKMLG